MREPKRKPIPPSNHEICDLADDMGISLKSARERAEHHALIDYVHGIDPTESEGQIEMLWALGQLLHRLYPSASKAAK
jgi:hypothetical protein